MQTTPSEGLGLWLGLWSGFWSGFWFEFWGAKSKSIFVRTETYRRDSDGDSDSG